MEQENCREVFVVALDAAVLQSLIWLCSSLSQQVAAYDLFQRAEWLAKDDDEQESVCG